MPLIKEETLETLIGEAYDAALDATKWETFLARFAGIYRGSALIYRQDPAEIGARVYARVNVDPAMKKPYESYYSTVRPWRAQLDRAPLGQVVVPLADWIDDRTYRQSEYYNDFLARHDLYHHLSAVLLRENRSHTAIVIARPYRAGDFAAEERRLAQMLLPHLQRALRANHYLQAAALQRQALLLGLEELSLGVVLASGDGRVLFANRVAEELLAGGDGLTAQQQCLRAMTPALTQQLHRYIREAVDAGAGTGTQLRGALSLPRRSGGDLSLLICPFPIAQSDVIGPTAPAALIFMRGPNGTAAIRQSDLRRIYGLTIAEAKLVGALLAGMPLRHYAAQGGISTETAKTQLRQVFAKTGQRRQADLIRHILSNPIIQLAPKELPDGE